MQAQIRNSCDSGIYSVQFVPSWPRCVFLGLHLEGITHRVARALTRWRTKDDMVFVFREAGPKDAYDTLQALTTTTPKEVAMATSKILTNPDREELDLDAVLEQQQLHDKLQYVLDFADKELINALHVVFDSLKRSLQRQKGGAE